MEGESLPWKPRRIRASYGFARPPLDAQRDVADDPPQHLAVRCRIAAAARLALGIAAGAMSACIPHATAMRNHRHHLHHATFLDPTVLEKRNKPIRLPHNCSGHAHTLSLFHEALPLQANPSRSTSIPKSPKSQFFLPFFFAKLANPRKKKRFDENGCVYKNLRGHQMMCTTRSSTPPFQGCCCPAPLPSSSFSSSSSTSSPQMLPPPDRCACSTTFTRRRKTSVFAKCYLALHRLLQIRSRI